MKYVYILLISTLCSKSMGQVTIEYIGNMGVLISDEENSVLVDGLHDFYGESYEFPPSERIDELVSNDGSEFPEIVGNLNTHYHGDHFDEKLTARFLEDNPGVHFLGTEQACSSLDHVLKNCLGEQSEITVSLGKIEVQAFYLDHANPSRLSGVQNIGFLVNIGGRLILHVGDTYFKKELFEKLDLASRKIDVAILPSWMAGSEKVKEWIDPKHILVTHIDPKRKEDTIAQVESIYSNAKFCTAMGEKFKY